MGNPNVICSMPGCQTAAGCQCGVQIIPTRVLMRQRLEVLTEREALIGEAEVWLEEMKAHTNCCGTPMVRRLVAALKN